jgi:hypothetical protein
VIPELPSATAASRYRTLDEGLIRATISRLRARIQERFPGSGLGKVADELGAIADEATANVAALAQPNWPIRVGAAVLVGAILAIVIAGALSIRVPAGVDGWAQLVQLVESAINDVVFIGIAIFFLSSVEVRLKRRRALRALHELRSVVHIVDMHQLTKDPEHVRSQQADTASSPARVLAPGELGRYLDYCSELLSLASKVAALYMERLNDPVVLAAVNEIETLAGGLSNKIWQKITLLGQRA